MDELPGYISIVFILTTFATLAFLLHAIKAIGIGADTLAKYLHQTTTGAGLAAPNQAGGPNCRVGTGTLVLIDETGMAGTREHARDYEYFMGAMRSSSSRTSSSVF